MLSGLQSIMEIMSAMNVSDKNGNTGSLPFSLQEDSGFLFSSDVHVVS